MSYISQLKTWYDPGFREEGVEVPRLSECGNINKLPKPDFTFLSPDGRIRPPKGRMFSEIVIEGSFEKMNRMSYMSIVVFYDKDDPAYGNFTYFGWIDKVTCLKDGVDFQQISIEWHVDLWRTYGKDATFGYGILKSYYGTESDLNSFIPKCPLQSIPYIRREFAVETDLSAPDTFVYTRRGTSKTYRIYWIAVVYVEDSSQTVTQRCALTPVFINTDGTIPQHDTLPQIKLGDYSTYLSLNLNYMLAGFSFYTGIAASKIAGSYLLTRCPYDYTLTGQDDELVLNIRDNDNINVYIDSYDDTLTEQHNKWFAPSLSVPTKEFTVTTDSFIASELQAYEVRDCHGLNVFNLPPRITVTSVKWYYELSATSAKMCVMFGNAEITTATGLRSMGLVADVPCMKLSLASNSWSDYVASGQRDFEAQQRRIAAEMGAANGTASSLASGMTKGRMSMLSGLTNAASSYMINRMYDSGIQENLDTAHAMQFDTIAYPGDDLQWLRFYGNEKLVKTKPDAYSRTQFLKWIRDQGVSVNESTVDCTTYCSSLGPVRIEDLIVGGRIPNEAKEYIKRRFARGVRLVAFTQVSATNE